MPLADIQDLAAISNQTQESVYFPWQLRETRACGDAWQQQGDSPVMRVPSAIVPTESNFLINPQHPAFQHYTISEPQSFLFDARLPSA